MKKLICLLAVFALVLPALAKPDFPNADFPNSPQPDFPQVNSNPSLQAAVNQQVSEATDAAVAGEPHDDAVFHIKMDVVSRFVGQMQDDNNVVTKKCAAVRIDKNWMIASLTCRGTTAVATAHDHYGNPYDKDVAFRHISSMKVEGVKVNAEEDVFVNEEAKAILIYLNPSNQKLTKELQDEKVIAPIVIPTNPKALRQSIEQAFINRENYCLPGRCSAEVSVDEYCVGNKCYKVEWKMIDGDAGDPLFIRSAKKKEYLVALNIAEIDGSDVQSGRFYKVFNSNTYNFMKNTIQGKDPSAWTRIAAGIKNEKNF